MENTMNTNVNTEAQAMNLYQFVLTDGTIMTIAAPDRATASAILREML